MTEQIRWKDKNRGILEQESKRMVEQLRSAAHVVVGGNQMGKTFDVAGTTQNLSHQRELDLRIECLRLATARGPLGDPVHEAKRFYDFLTGEHSPREKIEAALEQAGL